MWLGQSSAPVVKAQQQEDPVGDEIGDGAVEVEREVSQSAVNLGWNGRLNVSNFVIACVHSYLHRSIDGLSKGVVQGLTESSLLAAGCGQPDSRLGR